MPSPDPEPRRAATAPAARYDVLIIGAGLSGMYQLHLLRQLGVSVRVFEAGAGVGGTWYWNRYPGARFDSESWTYGFSFSPELLEEWEWSEHFSAQPETLRYCSFVADKLDLRRDIEFDSRIRSAVYDAAANEWEIETTDGRPAGAVQQAALRRGLLVLTAGMYANVIRTLMPLGITDEQLEEGLGILGAALAEAG